MYLSVLLEIENVYLNIECTFLKFEFLASKLDHFYVAGASIGLALTRKNQENEYECCKQLRNKI